MPWGATNGSTILGSNFYRKYWSPEAWDEHKRSIHFVPQVEQEWPPHQVRSPGIWNVRNHWQAWIIRSILGQNSKWDPRSSSNRCSLLWVGFFPLLKTEAVPQVFIFHVPSSNELQLSWPKWVCSQLLQADPPLLLGLEWLAPRQVLDLLKPGCQTSGIQGQKCCWWLF